MHKAEVALGIRLKIKSSKINQINQKKSNQVFDFYFHQSYDDKERRHKNCPYRNSNSNREKRRLQLDSPEPFRPIAKKIQVK